MPFQRRLTKRSARVRVRACLERLESRTLLAGVINFPDCLLRLSGDSTDAVPAEVGQIESKRFETAKSHVNQATIANSDAAGLSSIHESYRDWLEDLQVPPQDNVTDDLQPCPIKDNLTHESDSGHSDINLDDISDPSRDQLVDSAPDVDNGQPAAEPKPPFSILPIVAIPFSNYQPLPTRSNDIAVIPNAISPLEFHYFQGPMGANQFRESGLNAEPLGNYIVSERFVANSLIVVDDIRPTETSLAAHRETNRKRFVSRTENSQLQHAAQVDSHLSEDSALVLRARASIKEAEEIVRDAEAACAAVRIANECSDCFADRVPINAVAKSSRALLDTQATQIEAIRSLSDALRFSLLSLTSIVLSFRSSNSAVPPASSHRQLSQQKPRSVHNFARQWRRKLRGQ